MADKPLFSLDAEARMRAYYPLQWIIQRRAGKPCRRGSDSAAMRRTGWRGVSPFVGGTKTTLRRVLGEKGVPLTAEAQARLNALPERFIAFLAEIDSPQPDNARTARSHPLDGPERQPGRQRASADVTRAPAPA